MRVQPEVMLVDRRPALPVVAAALVAAGAAAVVVVPDLVGEVPRVGRAGAGQMAATAAVLVALSAVYRSVVAGRRRLPATWIGLSLAVDAAVVAVKFVLSPAGFARSDAELSEYVAVGLAVGPGYLAALVAVEVLRRRTRRREVPRWALWAALAGGAVVVAFAARAGAVAALGTPSSTYLDHAFSGSGLWLPALLAGAAVTSAAAFDAAAPAGPARAELADGAGLLVAYHLLWILYMWRLFG